MPGDLDWPTHSPFSLVFTQHQRKRRTCLTQNDRFSMVQSKYVQWPFAPYHKDFKQSRPVEASWKSGRVRWMEDFLAPGLTSALSAIGILLLSSVSLQHTRTRQWRHVQCRTNILHNIHYTHWAQNSKVLRVILIKRVCRLELRHWQWWPALQRLTSKYVRPQERQHQQKLVGQWSWICFEFDWNLIQKRFWIVMSDQTSPITSPFSN